MVEEITTKIIKAGKSAEVLEFERPYYKGYKRKGTKARKKTDIPLEDSIEYRYNNLGKSRTKLRRLIYANEDILKYFITLTFKDNITTHKKGYNRFNLFKDRLRKQYSKTKH